MGIEHRAAGGFRKFSALSKLCLSGQVLSSEMPYVSYPRPLARILVLSLPKRQEPVNMSKDHVQN